MLFYKKQVDNWICTLSQCHHWSQYF